MGHHSRKRNRRVHPSNTKNRHQNVTKNAETSEENSAKNARTSTVSFTKNAAVSGRDFAATNKTIRPKSRMMFFKEASRNMVISFDDSFDESDSEDESTNQSGDRTSATNIYQETTGIFQNTKSDSDQNKTLLQILEDNIKNGFGSITHPSVVCKPDLALKVRLMKRRQATALREEDYRKTCELKQQEYPASCVNSQNDDNDMRCQMYIKYGATDGATAESYAKLQKHIKDNRNNPVYSRGEKCLLRQRAEILKYRASMRPDKVETFDEYLQLLRKYKIRENKKEDEGYQAIRTPYRRRELDEGSYQNSTVIEEELPRLLRYTWKGKYSKLVFYLQDEEKHCKINRVDSRGRTALHYAASWGCLNSLKVLLQVPGIDLNTRDENGKTPLYKAVELNSLECVEALLDAGANAKIPARDSRDPLTSIIHFHGDERFEMFKFLYENGGYSKDQIEPYFVSLLHKTIAAEEKVVNLKIVNYLIEHGHDINAKEGKSRTPLYLAVMCGRTDILYLLLSHNANVYHMDGRHQSCAAYSKTNSLSHRILADFFKHGSPPVKQAVQCRKNGDDLDIMSKVLEQSMRRRQQIHHM